MLAVVFLLLAWQWFLVRARIHPLPCGRVVFSFSQVMWDEVWQRPQELAARLAGRIPVIYLSPVQVHRWLFTLGRRWRPVRLVTEPGGGRLVIVSPLVLSGHYKSHLLYHVNCRLLAAHASLWLRDADEVYAVTNTPYAVPVLAHLFERGEARSGLLKRLTYDVIDDFTAFEWSPPWGSELDAELMASADAVMTGTCELMELRRAVRPDVEFIPCGVDFDLFNREVDAMPADIATLPRPILGYFGSISERIDLELIRYLSGRFASASVVLIGPVHLSASAQPRARNIHYLGLKVHEELAAYAKMFSVGLIPFRITPATVKLNPVKTLEYLAAGVPVVSTALPDIERFFSRVVTVGRTHEEFGDLVQRTLDSPDGASVSAGREMARRASWGEMVARMGDMILGA